MGKSITWTGDDEILKRLERLAGDYPKATAAALYETGLEVHRDAVLLTPVDHGNLRQSAYVAPPRNMQDPTTEIGYGTDYAVPVHERTEVYHRVGQAKFLETPIMRLRRVFAERLIRKIRRFVDRGQGPGSISGTAPVKPNPPGSDT